MLSHCKFQKNKYSHCVLCCILDPIFSFIVCVCVCVSVFSFKIRVRKTSKGRAVKIYTCRTLKFNAHQVPTSHAWYSPLEIPLDVNKTHSANACILGIMGSIVNIYIKTSPNQIVPILNISGVTPSKKKKWV